MHFVPPKSPRHSPHPHHLPGSPQQRESKLRKIECYADTQADQTGFLPRAPKAHRGNQKNQSASNANESNASDQAQREPLKTRPPHPHPPNPKTKHERREDAPPPNYARGSRHSFHPPAPLMSGSRGTTACKQTPTAVRSLHSPVRSSTKKPHSYSQDNPSCPVFPEQANRVGSRQKRTTRHHTAQCCCQRGPTPQGRQDDLQNLPLSFSPNHKENL
mmetsp:Transcript_25572/g.50036  ORF Transcript_25572/g.50036 Transcript_25572/m.50036 type:complete len:217 (-) Transcript_25572:150-800(-)